MELALALALALSLALSLALALALSSPLSSPLSLSWSVLALALALVSSLSTRARATPPHSRHSLARAVNSRDGGGGVAHARPQVLATFHNSHEHEVIVYWLHGGVARDSFKLKPDERQRREARVAASSCRGGGGGGCSILCSLSQRREAGVAASSCRVGGVGGAVPFCVLSRSGARCAGVASSRLMLSLTPRDRSKRLGRWVSGISPSHDGRHPIASPAPLCFLFRDGRSTSRTSSSRATRASPTAA